MHACMHGWMLLWLLLMTDLYLEVQIVCHGSIWVITRISSNLQGQQGSIHIKQKQ